MENKKENQYQELFKTIPRTPEDMAELEDKILKHDTEEVLAKAHKHNERIEAAKKIVRMFETPEFQRFWKIVHDDQEKEIDGGVRHIKGQQTETRFYDPLGQLSQLNLIQGGLEMLDTQTQQMEIWKKTAEGKEIDVEELRSAFSQMKTEAQSNN